MIKVHVFHTGLVRVDQAIPLHENNPLAKTGVFRGEKKKRSLPVSCYLIEHPRGKILIDAGWHSKYAKEKIKGYLGMVDKVSKPIIKEDESVDAHLQKLGISPSDLDYVLISHLDLDHVSGLKLVKDAKHIMASKEEIEAAAKGGFRYMKENWEGIEIEPFEFKDNGIGPVHRSLDFYDDGSIILIHTPGHSKGHISVKISSDDGHYLILAGDAAYVEESYTEHTIPGFSVDDELSTKSLDYLIECRADPLCLGVFANHDPNIAEQILEI